MDSVFYTDIARHLSRCEIKHTDFFADIASRKVYVLVEYAFLNMVDTILENATDDDEKPIRDFIMQTRKIMPSKVIKGYHIRRGYAYIFPMPKRWTYEDKLIKYLDEYYIYVALRHFYTSEYAHQKVQKWYGDTVADRCRARYDKFDKYRNYPDIAASMSPVIIPHAKNDYRIKICR